MIMGSGAGDQASSVAASAALASAEPPAAASVLRATPDGSSWRAITVAAMSVRSPAMLAASHGRKGRPFKGCGKCGGVQDHLAGTEAADGDLYGRGGRGGTQPRAGDPRRRRHQAGAVSSTSRQDSDREQLDQDVTSSREVQNLSAALPSLRAQSVRSSRPRRERWSGPAAGAAGPDPGGEGQGDQGSGSEPHPVAHSGGAEHQTLGKRGDAEG